MRNYIDCMAACIVVPKFLDYQPFRIGSALLQTFFWNMCTARKKDSMREAQALLLSAILNRLCEVPLEHTNKLTIFDDSHAFSFITCITAIK